VRAIKTTTISILAIGLLAGSAVAVTAQDDEAATDAPVGSSYFTGELISEFTPTVNGSNTEVNGRIEGRGVLFEGDAIEVSDPRVSGSLTRAGNANVHPGIGDSEIIVFQADAWLIENDAGTWSGHATGLVHGGPDGPGGEDATEISTVVLTGEGGYEGHTLYLIVDWTAEQAPAVEGAVFVGDAPPFPEVPAPTE
jgi:hypothetical protein